MSEETDEQLLARIDWATPLYYALLGEDVRQHPATIITDDVPKPGFLVVDTNLDELRRLAWILGDTVNDIPVYYLPRIYLRLSELIVPMQVPEPRTRTVEL